MGTREKILNVSYREFAEKGYDGASMGSIAEKVGISKPAIYHYFQSKEELYKQIALGIDQFSFDDLEDVLHATDRQSYKKALRNYGARMVSRLECSQERLMFVSNAQVQMRRLPALFAEMDTHDKKWRSSLQDALFLGIELGAVSRDCNIEVEADFLVSLISGFSEMMLRQKKGDFLAIWNFALDKAIFLN